MRLRPATLVLALTAALAPWRAAHAQPYDGLHHRAVAALCGWDLGRYCGNLEIRRLGHLACLARHADSLSPPCYRALRLAAAVDGCAGDVERHCGQIPPGGGRVLACLRGNADRLSPTCARALRGPGPGFGPRAGLPPRRAAVPDGPEDAPGYAAGGPIK